MHHIAAGILCSTLLIILSSCKSILVKSDKITLEVLEQSGQWNEAFARRDIPSLMKLFANDAQLATAGGKWKTKDEGQLRFASLLVKRPDLRWFIKPREIVINEVWSVAYETGEWTEWWSETDGVAKIGNVFHDVEENYGRAMAYSCRHIHAAFVYWLELLPTARRKKHQRQINYFLIIADPCSHLPSTDFYFIISRL